MKQNIPNFFTILNLLCGSFGIVIASENNILWASYLVGSAAVFDFLDGALARLLKTKTEIGKQFDSLADIISFGLLPAVIMYHLLKCGLEVNPQILSTLKNLIPYIAFIIPVFSAIRLAKFNIDARQTEKFVGLPTPANALFIASLPCIAFEQYKSNEFIYSMILNPYLLLGIIIIFSCLLVSKIPLFSLKFKEFSPKENKTQLIFLLLSLILIIFLQFLAVPIIILLYIIFGGLNFNSSSPNLDKQEPNKTQGTRNK